MVLFLSLALGCDGGGKEGVGVLSIISLDVSEIEAGDNESSAKLTVSVDRDKWGSGAIEVDLTWKCEILDKSGNLFKEGNVKVFVPSGVEKAETKITGLPAKTSLEEEIQCTVTATGDLPDNKGMFFQEELFSINSGQEPELTIDIINSKFVNPNSFVHLKLLLTREGKPLTAGDAWFDSRVEVEIAWSCGSADGNQKVSIDADKSDKIVKVEILSVSDKESCNISAHIAESSISDATEFILGEGTLKVVLTKHVYGEALGYVVTENDERFTAVVNLEIFGAEWQGRKYCPNTYLVQQTNDKNYVNYGKTISNVAPTNEKSVFLTGFGDICSIAVTSGAGDLQKRGKTGHASVIRSGQGSGFSLQINNATIVPNSQNTFKGKVWVYLVPDGASKGNLKGYLDTGNSSISAATKLQKSLDDNEGVASLAAGFYIIFYEQEDVLRVFSGQYN